MAPLPASERPPPDRWSRATPTAAAAVPPQPPLRDVLRRAGPPIPPEVTPPDKYAGEVEAGMARFMSVVAERDRFKGLYEAEVLKTKQLEIDLANARESERLHVATVVEEAKAAQAAAEERAEVLRGEVARLQQLLQQHDNEASQQYAKLRADADAARAETAALRTFVTIVMEAGATVLAAKPDASQEPEAEDTTG